MVKMRATHRVRVDAACDDITPAAPALARPHRMSYAGIAPAAPQAGIRPLGVLFWAHASDEVAERLAQGVKRLRPQDWKSGDELWVVEAIAPFGGAEETVRDLKEKVFGDRALNFLATGSKGAVSRSL